MNLVKTILHQHKLKVTSARMAILETIINSDKLLSESEIKEINRGIDRITFYRSIKSLLNTKIIQGVITEEKVIKYNFFNNKEKGSTAIQFYCSECQRLIDLNSSTQALLIPEGYEEKACCITITGTCKTCNNKLL